MKNENQCVGCESKLTCRESWIEVNGEYRHIQYLYCTKCDYIYSMDGELILKNQRFVLTSDHN